MATKSLHHSLTLDEIQLAIMLRFPGLEACRREIVSNRLIEAEYRVTAGLEYDKNAFLTETLASLIIEAVALASFLGIDIDAAIRERFSHEQEAQNAYEQKQIENILEDWQC